MAQFQVEVLIHAPISVVWTRLTDWSAHARLAPLTTIRVIGSGDRPGSGFVSRTGIGPLAFDDPMEIEEFEPPREGAAGSRAGEFGAEPDARAQPVTVAASAAESSTEPEFGAEAGPDSVAESVTGAESEPRAGTNSEFVAKSRAEAGVAAPPRPAARFRVRKTGWLLRGWVVAELWPAADRPGPDRVPVTGPGAVDPAQIPEPPAVTRLIWTEELRLPLEGVTRFADPLVAAVARAGYGMALRKLGREIEGETRG